MVVNRLGEPVRWEDSLRSLKKDVGSKMETRRLILWFNNVLSNFITGASKGKKVFGKPFSLTFHTFFHYTSLNWFTEFLTINAIE